MKYKIWVIWGKITVKSILINFKGIFSMYNKLDVTLINAIAILKSETPRKVNSGKSEDESELY